ncbi:hypothetical protein OHD49_00800 [Escherichia coli]|nr:hypothetical protein [Escherichia coli]
MKNIKTHTGLLIHKEQTRRVRLHETPTALVPHAPGMLQQKPVAAAAALTVSAG